ncbi:hypothetical protein MHBO_000520 [Bonamia ostreae]|uniref:Peptidase M48 domain-containing protein n=1 Tax=Bonamia ostreae TaxID=126728 RepID=A0ABV2AFY2_9EUKA
MYGCCGQKYIVLYDTLLKQCSEQQIIAILGHELGHWKKSHIIKMFIVLEAFMFSTFYAMRLFLFSDDLYTSFGFTENPVIIGTFLFFVLYEPIEQIRSVLFNGYMRYLENEADDFSSDLGYSEHLVEGLLALERENKSGLITDPIYSLFKHNHPPIIERVRRLRLKMNKEL